MSAPIVRCTLLMAALAVSLAPWRAAAQTRAAITLRPAYAAGQRFGYRIRYKDVVHATSVGRAPVTQTQYVVTSLLFTIDRAAPGGSAVGSLRATSYVATASWAPATPPQGQSQRLAVRFLADGRYLPITATVPLTDAQEFSAVGSYGPVPATPVRVGAHWTWTVSGAYEGVPGFTFDQRMALPSFAETNVVTGCNLAGSAPVCTVTGHSGYDAVVTGTLQGAPVRVHDRQTETRQATYDMAAGRVRGGASQSESRMFVQIAESGGLHLGVNVTDTQTLTVSPLTPTGSTPANSV